MSIFKRTPFAIVAVLLVMTCLAGIPRQATAPAQSTSLSQPIAVDPQITIGKLQNGLQYYVRANAKPEKRAELRLAVKAGDINDHVFGQSKSGLLQRFTWSGPGKRTLHASLGAGNLTFRKN